MAPLTWIALVFLALAVAFLWAGGAAFRRRRLIGGTVGSLAGLLGVALAALCALMAVGTQGYRALTYEEPVARVDVAPTGPQRFRATVTLAGTDSSRSFRVTGDQLYVDAHVLKWKPVANLLGLHTLYELDRLGGRYVTLPDERSKERTLHSLSEEKPVDLFTLRRAFPVFAPLVDAEYGSATFVPAGDTTSYEILVGTTGLLAREVEPAR